MNPVIGDEALLASGVSCPASMEEVDKIRCHVSYALGQLQAKTTQYQNNRMAILSTLETYIIEGVFPQNENNSGSDKRYPCFIDSAGIPCAVAHLMQQSGAGNLANSIAASHKYDSIAQILVNTNLSPRIESWARSNGLSVKDLALIQPTYADFYAEEARALFSEVESKLLEAASSDTKVGEVERNIISNLMVRFGDKMAYHRVTQRDVPDYLKRIEQLENKVPVEKFVVESETSKARETLLTGVLLSRNPNSLVVRKLIKLLRREIEGFCNSSVPPTVFEYKDFLPPEDFLVCGCIVFLVGTVLLVGTYISVSLGTVVLVNLVNTYVKATKG